MSYRLLSEISLADAAFECEGGSVEELFASAVDALTGLMVQDLESIRRSVHRSLHLEESGVRRLDHLLQRLLERLIYWKDVDGILLRCDQISVTPDETTDRIILDAKLSGEPIDPGRHQLGSDVKAVTFHRLQVKRAGDLWRCQVVVDI